MFPLFPGLSFVISIHAPAKGATLLKCSSRSDGRDFNPRSREGSDHDKGRCEGNGDDFNPRSREGSDPATPPSWKIQRDFNPRSREGSDPTQRKIKYHEPDFNPRSREGSDQPGAHGFVNTLSFQSTLPRRERQHLLTSFRLQYGYSLFHLTNKI